MLLFLSLNIKNSLLKGICAMEYKTIVLNLTNKVKENNKELKKLPDDILRVFSSKLENIKIPCFEGSDKKDPYTSTGVYFSYFEEQRLKRAVNKDTETVSPQSLFKPLDLLYPKIVFGYLDIQLKEFKNDGVPLTTMAICYQYGTYLHIKFYDSHSGMCFDPKLYKIHDKTFIDADINAIRKSYKVFGHPVAGKTATVLISDLTTSEDIGIFFDNKTKEIMDDYFRVISDNLVLAYGI